MKKWWVKNKKLFIIIKYMIEKFKSSEKILFINKYNKYNLLVFTSSTFLLPSYYAYINKFYILSLLSFIISIISSGHWYNVNNFSLRIMDLIIAKVCFVTYLTVLIFYTNFGFIDILLLKTMILFYYISNNRLSNKKEDWVYYHVLFHTFATIDQIVTLYGLIRK